MFVSHVSEDRVSALEIVAELERRGIRCWIAPRDVRPGTPFDDEIANAIEASQAMLLIFSEHCNDSAYIRREVTVAGESQKVIIPFRIENAEPKHGLRVRLSDLHWLDGFASREGAVDELVKIFPASKGGAIAQESATNEIRQPAPLIVESDAGQAPGGANVERRGLAMDKERPKPEERQVRASAEPKRLADEDARDDLRPAQPRRLWPLSRTVQAAGGCLILIAIGIGAYLSISSYIKFKTQQPPVVQPTPASKVVTTAHPPPAIAPPAFSSAGCKPETASFYDDFHKPDAGWNFTPGELAHYADGQLVVTPAPDRFFSPKYLSLRYQNAEICAHIQSPSQLKAPDAAAIAGVVFWAADHDNFYLAEILPSGSYAIYRRIAGNWINVIPRTKSDQVKSGTKVVNEVSVVLVDNFGALFVNSVKVQEFRGQPPTGGSAVGLYAGSEATASDEWRFLDIAVMDNGKSKPVTLPPAPSGPTDTEKCQPVNTTDFQDTFTKPDPGWGFSDATTHYIDGQLLLKPEQDKGWVQLYRPLVFRNAIVCVTVKSPLEVSDLEDTAQGGAAFWATDTRNYYVATIYPNGTFALFRKLDGQWLTVVPRTTSDAIKKGIGATNELQVVLNKGTGLLYVNGIQIHEFRGQPPEVGGATGLYAESEKHQQSEWRFIKFTVVENQ
jgi:hypothetical protein